jgi:hypothetical protein
MRIDYRAVAFAARLALDRAHCLVSWRDFQQSTGLSKLMEKVRSFRRIAVRVHGMPLATPAIAEISP